MQLQLVFPVSLGLGTGKLLAFETLRRALSLEANVCKCGESGGLMKSGCIELARGKHPSRA